MLIAEAWCSAYRILWLSFLLQIPEIAVFFIPVLLVDVAWLAETLLRTMTLAFMFAGHAVWSKTTHRWSNALLRYRKWLADQFTSAFTTGESACLSGLDKSLKSLLTFLASSKQKHKSQSMTEATTEEQSERFSDL